MPRIHCIQWPLHAGYTGYTPFLPLVNALARLVNRERNTQSPDHHCLGLPGEAPAESLYFPAVGCGFSVPSSPQYFPKEVGRGARQLPSLPAAMPSPALFTLCPPSKKAKAARPKTAAQVMGSLCLPRSLGPQPATPLPRDGPANFIPAP